MYKVLIGHQAEPSEINPGVFLFPDGQSYDTTWNTIQVYSANGVGYMGAYNATSGTSSTSYASWITYTWINEQWDSTGNEYSLPKINYNALINNPIYVGGVDQYWVSSRASLPIFWFRNREPLLGLKVYIGNPTLILPSLLNNLTQP